MNRRQALITFASAALPCCFWQFAAAPAGQLAATNKAETQVETLFRKALPDLGDAENTASLSVLRVQYAPGGESRPHTHPVPAFVYVLRGVVESRVEGEMTRRCGAGDASDQHGCCSQATTGRAREFRRARP
jgi:hypothetical protein